MELPDGIEGLLAGIAWARAASAAGPRSFGSDFGARSVNRTVDIHSVLHWA